MVARGITKRGCETSHGTGRFVITQMLFSPVLFALPGAQTSSVISVWFLGHVDGPDANHPASVIPSHNPAALPRGSRRGPSRFIVTWGIEAEETCM